MTDKELRRLSRAELLDILYEQQKRYEESLAENQALRQQMEERTLRIAAAGSIAEAAVQVNGVFEAAQAAADQYLASVKAAAAEMAQKTDEAQRQREAILQASPMYSTVLLVRLSPVRMSTSSSPVWAIAAISASICSVSSCARRILLWQLKPQ